MDCGQLPNPANGLKFGSEFTYNKVLTFDCNPGYKLVGNRKRRCQESGSWSGTAPICVGKYLSCNVGPHLMLSEQLMITTTILTN